MRRMKEEYKKTKMHNWWFLQGLSCWGLCTLCSFSKVLEGFGAFFYSSPRDSSNLMPALFCLPRFYCVTFLHFLFGYKMSYAIFILFLCSFFWDMLCMITYSLIFISFLLGNFNIFFHVLDFSMLKMEIMRILWQYRRTHLGFRNNGRERERGQYSNT